MDNGTGITPVMPIGNGMDGFGGGNSFMWIFGLLILMGMFNGGLGGFGNNGFAGAALAGNLATQNDVQRGFDALNLQNQSRDILAAVNDGTAQAVAATNNTFHDTLAALNDKYGELARDIAAVQVGQANALANQNQCCCETKQLIQSTAATTDAAIAQNRYEAALGNAALQKTIIEEAQKTRDVMAQDKIEALQNQVNQLQLAQATAGVLRFPNQWSYGAGPFPPIFGGCCNQGNI